MISRFFFIMALFPVFANAQQQGSDSLAYEKAKTVIESFIRSTVGIKNGRVDLREYNQFKELFDVKGVAEDDYNVFFQYNSNSSPGTYVIGKNPKPFDLYAHDIALQIVQIEIDSIGTMQPVATDLKNHLTYSIYRRVSFAKPRKYVLQEDYIDKLLQGRNILFDNNNDSITALNKLKERIRDTATYFFTSSSTLTITLVDNGDHSFKIKSVSSQNERIVCHNDTDRDAVLQRDELLDNWAGDFTSNGRPDYDLDGIPDAVKGVPLKLADRCKCTYGTLANRGCPKDYFLNRRAIEGFVGVQMNVAGINLSELNQLGYVDASGNSATDVLQSSKGNLKNPGLRPGIYAGGNYTYYAGRVQRDIGLSVGVNFTAFFADYRLTEPVMYTFKSNDSEHDYRRRVTLDSLNESIRYNIFNFPVMFSWRFYIGKEDKEGKEQRKSLLNFKAGPSLMVFSTTSEYDAYISFEGLYQADENGIIYKDPFDDADSYNIYFTAESLRSRNPFRSAEDVFRQLRNNNANYDFADSKNFRGKQKNESRITVGFNLDFNFQRNISDEMSFKAGLQAVYAPIPEAKEKYIPINKTTDPYNSIYNSSAKTSYMAFGLQAGLVYNF
jgi:hypothetical protein